jgi:hypothetical protein
MIAVRNCISVTVHNKCTVKFYYINFHDLSEILKGLIRIFTEYVVLLLKARPKKKAKLKKALFSGSKVC